MLKILSIQSDILGNKTYGKLLRDCFSGYADVKLDSHWYNDGRSVPTRILHRMVSVSLPVLGRNGQNLDRRRARIEWSYGRTSRILTERRLRDDNYRMLHFHTQIQAYGSLEIMRKVPAVISTDMTAAQASRELVVPYPHTFNLNIQMDRRVFHAAAHVVTFSEWARQSVIEDYNVPPGKVTAIAPGARLKAFEQPCFCPRELPRILFVGGDFKRKGGWDLLAVFANHFVGKAELHLVTNEPIPDPPPSVYLHRGVSAYTKEWHQHFREADIFVLPSYADATPQVLQEASGYGLALLGTRVGGIPELILEGANGYLIQPGSKEELREQLAGLIRDREALMTLRKTSRQIAADRFDADTNVRHLADLFKNVAAV